MTTITHTPAACDAELKLRRAAFALQQMTGSHVFDLGALANMLKIDDCEDHRPAAADSPVIVKTSGAPLSLDPHDSYYRPPYTGHAA
ncbi:hypothetical protein SEA_JINKIES_61 [Arthrobacter phage Jinkies]|uniref:Uncharacterized protein n=1 Tax=Arthrobacter phage Jinkies TaxID=2743903 RepID=A0A7T0IFH3_9CAUD|nr:hypothetical protein SEA_JINKIES_61 [Arthrobacter phage Jinkies]